MKLRKAVSLILALVLALSVSVPTLAYTPDASKGEIDLAEKGTGNSTGDLTYVPEGSTPVIQMVVPAAVGKLIFNPLGLEYDATELLGSKTDAQGQEVPNMQSEQIITKEQFIKNLSAANVQVDLKATVTVGPTGTTASATDPKPSTSSIDPTSSKAAAKSIFLYLEMYMPKIKDGTNGVELDWSKIGATSETFTWYDGNYTTKSLPKNYSTIVITAKDNKPVEKTNVAILAAAVPADGVEASDGNIAGLQMDKLRPDDGGVLAFKVSGNATGTLSDGQWEAGDAPNVTLVFNFKFTSVDTTFKSA